MTKSDIGTVEAVMLILSVVVTHTILSLPREMVVSTKSATIINLIFVSIIAILISYLIVKFIDFLKLFREKTLLTFQST